MEHLKIVLKVTVEVVCSCFMIKVVLWSLVCWLLMSSSEKSSWLLMVFSAHGGVSGIFDQLLQLGSSAFFFFFFGSGADEDVSICFVPSYPMELTLFMVSMYVVTASSRGASIVLLKLRALKHQDRELVMIVWALRGSVAKVLVMSVCLTAVLSLSPERTLLLDLCRRIYALTHIWGKAERLTCFFQFFELVWLFSCVFLEVSKALKSNSSLLPETSDEKVVHKVAHPFCCVYFNQQNLPFLKGAELGVTDKDSKQQACSSVPSLLLSPCCPAQPAAPCYTLLLLKSGHTSATKKWQFIDGYHFWFLSWTLKCF